jgi:hypothetical protein
MPSKKQPEESEDPFASFVDVLKEMISAGYGFQEVLKTLEDLGLSKPKAILLIEMNAEKQLPEASGKIEAIVKQKIEKHIEALKHKVKRRVASKKRRTTNALDSVYSEILEVLNSEAQEKKPVFEKRYYAYALLLNQAEIERKELIAFLLELGSLKLSRKAKARIFRAVNLLEEQ